MRAPGEALARECVTRLRSREWDGDDELAESLEAQLGSGPARLLRPLAVDLEDWRWCSRVTRCRAAGGST